MTRKAMFAGMVAILVAAVAAVAGADPSPTPTVTPAGPADQYTVEFGTDNGLWDECTDDPTSETWCDGALDDHNVFVTVTDPDGVVTAVLVITGPGQPFTVACGSTLTYVGVNSQSFIGDDGIVYDGDDQEKFRTELELLPCPNTTTTTPSTLSTTTTSPDTSTTTLPPSSSTTTVPPTGGTIPPATTPTVPTGSTTPPTTTRPPVDLTPPPPSTTTSLPPGLIPPEVTLPPVVSTPPTTPATSTTAPSDQPPPTLPHTGPNVRSMLLGVAAVFVAGGVAVLATIATYERRYGQDNDDTRDE